MVNWDVDDLVADCQAVGLEVVETEAEESKVERRITTADLERWFGSAPAGERPSYADHLLRAITPAEFDQIRILYERQLENQIISWSSSNFYLVAR
jgi:hypothetical protein